MSAFHEAIKNVFAEIEKFINLLKDENLSKSAQKERNKIVSSLQKIFNDYESINPHTDEGSSNSSKDDSRFTSGSTHSHGSHGSEEDSTSDHFPYATVKSLTGAKLGYLLKKPTDLLEKISKSKQMKYCAVHKNMLYWFQKPNDKKPQGTVHLSGYEFKDVSPSEKELVFELAAPKKKAHQFQVDNKEDYESWKQAIETGIKFKEHIEEIEEGENYEPIDEVVIAAKNRLTSMTTSTSSATSSNSTMKKSITDTALPPVPTQEAEEPQEEYVMDAISTCDTTDVVSPPPKAQPTATSTPKNLKITQTTVTKDAQPSIAKTKKQESFDEIEDEGLIYEAIEPMPTSASNSKSPAGILADESRSSVPSLPPPRPPLPTPTKSAADPPPLPERGANIPVPPSDNKDSINKSNPKICPKIDINTAIPPEEDYENMFYGNWSCVGSSANELSFECGDLIHILNRDLEADDWWIGERCGDIGLVPKSYLVPAYELVA